MDTAEDDNHIHQYPYAADQEKRPPGNPFQRLSFIGHTEEGKCHCRGKTGQSHIHFKKHYHDYHCTDAEERDDLCSVKRSRVGKLQRFLRFQFIPAESNVNDSGIHGG